ncbi:MAG: AraC family transcriptional regulator [Spirochaetaceae bacterium]|jgi:AraC-like DNA-binding protein/uncharacterized RmlC-like cupin family protein|nr:AraC family transcriptional regulator [Spirochaetaceae bacterium]
MTRKNDARDKYCFTIPADFLEEYAGNSLSEFITLTAIGKFPKAEHHYCLRNEGIDTAVFIYCYEGAGYYRLNRGETKTIGPGRMLIIPPGTPHLYGAAQNNPWSIFWMHSKGLFFNSFYENWASSESVPIADSFCGRISELFYQCFYILKMPYRWEEFFHLCHLAAAIISLIPGASKQSAGGITVNGNTGIESAVSYMKKRLHECITLEELSYAAGFSASHLHYLFRKYSGYAPIEYFLRMKIQAAAKDIFFSDLTVREIAEAYGIEDPYYFSRLFKKIIGLSPMQYRKSPH